MDLSTGRRARQAGLAIRVCALILVTAWLAQPRAAQAADRTIAGIPNVEDMAVAPGGRWVIASSMAGGSRKTGGLHLVDPRTGSHSELYTGGSGRGVRGGACQELPAGAMAPHGISLRTDVGGHTQLLAVNHGLRQSIEIFDLIGEKRPELRWTGCLLLPAGALPNAVAATPDGVVYVSNNGPPLDGSPSPSMIGGEILRWDAALGWRAVAGSKMVGPNGLLVSPDGQRLYVASWLGSEVVEFTLGSGAAVSRSVKLDFFPDNLRWGRGDAILAAGQRGPTAEVADCYMSTRDACAMPSRIAAFRASSMTLCGAQDVPLDMTTVAAPVGNEIWVGTVRGNAILRAGAPAAKTLACKR